MKRAAGLQSTVHSSKCHCCECLCVRRGLDNCISHPLLYRTLHHGPRLRRPPPPLPQREVWRCTCSCLQGIRLNVASCCSERQSMVRRFVHTPEDCARSFCFAALANRRLADTFCRAQRRLRYEICAPDAVYSATSGAECVFRGLSCRGVGLPRLPLGLGDFGGAGDTGRLSFLAEHIVPHYSALLHPRRESLRSTENSRK